MATDTAQPDGEKAEQQRRESLMRDSLLIVEVAGMHSHACEEKIVAALGGRTGVREAEVDFASKQASVIFDAHKITAHQLVETIEAQGYRCANAFTGSGGGAVA